MPSVDTIRHSTRAFALLFGALALGCSSSHGPAGSDGSVGDASTVDGGECPPVFGSCQNACCTASVAPTFDSDCNPICPGGYSLVDRCAPAPDCGTVDAGTCPPIDPGLCYGGPCCDDEVVAEIDPDTCTAHCPAGYAARDECAVDPAARCAAPWRTCGANAECELAIDSCCGPCGIPSLDDYDAINREQRDAHREAVCPEPTPCPDCAVGMNPALGATCDGGLCQGFDVRAMDLSACETDDDCRLRVTDCCECGGDTSPYSLIAIRKDSDADYQALVCDDVDCAECAPAYPTDAVEAYCADDGHCDTRPLATTGG